MRRTPVRREFHLGPLFSVDTGFGRSRIALLSGLIGLKRDAAKASWKPFIFDFFSKPGKKTAASASP